MSANIVTVDEESLRKDIKNLVRKTVEETLNALLDEEASELVGAGRYERTAGREAYRSGHYARKLVTGAGEVELNVPKLRGATFQTAVIERYRRRETSVEEAIVEMYLAGVSTRRIEDVSELLWGAPVSSGTVSNLNEKAFASIEAWRQRPLEGDYPYVFRRRHLPQAQLGRVLRERGRSGGHRRQLHRRPGGHRLRGGLHRAGGLVARVLLVAQGARALRRAARHRRQVRGDARCARGGVPRGTLPALHGPLLPKRVGKGARDQEKAVARMLKAIHAQESREACSRKAAEVADELDGMRLGAAARTVRDGFSETLAYTDFPPEHWRRIRTNNGIERINREIRRRTRVVGTFPDGNSALMLVTARLKYIVEHEWGKRRYLDMSKLEEMDELSKKAEG